VPFTAPLAAPPSAADGRQMVAIIGNCLRAVAADQQRAISDVSYGNALPIATAVGEVERLAAAVKKVRTVLYAGSDAAQVGGTAVVANWLGPGVRGGLGGGAPLGGRTAAAHGRGGGWGCCGVLARFLGMPGGQGSGAAAARPCWSGHMGSCTPRLAHSSHTRVHKHNTHTSTYTCTQTLCTHTLAH
jgi:hypothetical protein